MLMILIADPQPESRAQLSRALVNVGYRVIAVATGMEAAQVLIEMRPRLIVMDLDLKWVTGWRLVDLLRRNDDLARIPVLVLSTSLVGPPGVPLLTRPIDCDRFVETVDRLWSAVPVPNDTLH
jgi:CheY-like chemotaxis protein